MSNRPPALENFGRNLTFQPQVFAVPRSESEVLALLKQHTGRTIRVVGRLHSWSEAPAGNDVVFDLRHLNEVATEQRDGRVWATIGAGCQIKRVLTELEKTGVTLPSLGLISEQALAGAISTGTHGSGKNSLSHYAAEVRIATYDPETGEPVILTISGGPELRAARCSLGCVGVILSISLWAVPCYRVEEHIRRHSTLNDVLASESEYPLQQFYFQPWSWEYYGQHRRVASSPRSWLAPLYRLYFFLTFDIGMHVVLLFLLRRLKSRSWLKFFYRWLLSWTVIRGWRVVDGSSAMLIMEHELFVHIEIEVFVKRSRLPGALSFVSELLRHFDGDSGALSSTIRDSLASRGLLDSILPCAGSYTHHYPICVRRILPDDTLLSMASGDGEDWYAISIISLAKPREREGFFLFANYLAQTTAALFEARFHWGKHCPIDANMVETLYPHLAEFRAVCQELDPGGRFRNEWTSRLLFMDQPK